jgi:hypothetical protein
MKPNAAGARQASFQTVWDVDRLLRLTCLSPRRWLKPRGTASMKKPLRPRHPGLSRELAGNVPGDSRCIERCTEALLTALSLAKPPPFSAKRAPCGARLAGRLRSSCRDIKPPAVGNSPHSKVPSGFVYCSADELMDYCRSGEGPWELLFLSIELNRHPARSL